MFFLLLLILPGVRSQEASPATYVEGRTYQYHPFNSVKFLQPKHTKKGPVQFPNDAPPPPPTPLIVTSRPLSESIARSELNPNNSQTAQSRLNQVSFRPEYLARVKDYKPIVYSTVTPVYDFESSQISHGDSVKIIQGSRKDNFYNDYEKRLMQSIHRRKADTKKLQNLWDEPIQRKKIIQKPLIGLNARKAMFEDDESVKSKEIKVFHGSLYSREANYNNNDDNEEQEKGNNYEIKVKRDSDTVDFRRSNYGESRSRTRERKIPYRRSENVNYYNDRRQFRHSQRRKYLSDETVRNPKMRTMNNLNNLNANDDNNKNINTISRTDNFRDNKDENLMRRPPDSLENLSSSIERYDNIRHVSRAKNLTDNNDSNLRKGSSYNRDKPRDNIDTIQIKKIGERTKYLSDNDDSIIKKRMSLNLKELNEKTDMTVKKRPSNRLEDLNDNNERIIIDKPLDYQDSLSNNKARKKYLKSRTSYSAENLSKPRKVIKWRPLEDESENIDRIINEPSRSSEYKIGTVNRNITPYPPKSVESSILKWKPAKSAESPDSYEKNLKKHPPHSAEDLSGHHEEIQKKSYSPDSRSQNSHNEDSEEAIQQRVVRPLYGPVNHGFTEQKPLSKPLKYQLKTPDYTNYYHANDDGHDTSKEYNRGENYAFSYTVKDHKTGDDFSHSQQSTGSATNGQYRVKLPDGRTQVVSYTADENGYNADVRYDEHLNHDNSIDVGASKENRNRKDDLPLPYKHNNAANAYNVHIDSRDLADNGEYSQHHYKEDKSHHYNNEYSKRPINYNAVHQDYNHPDDFIEHANDFEHKNTFTDTTNVLVDDPKNSGLTDHNNDYLDHYNDKNAESEDKVLRVHDDDDVQFTGENDSKELMDYSSEFNQGYKPHKSKYSSFNNNKNGKAALVPSYEDLKDLFVTNANGRRQNTAVPIVSTIRPNYDVTTERVVVISPKKPNLYTNIRNFVPVTPSPLIYSTPYASTPSGYLLSTITNLKNQINLVNKPVLSNHYIDKINKYLSYK